MKSYFHLCFLLYFTFYLTVKCEDEEIPVVEGDGGVVKTAIEDDVLILTRDNFDLQVMSRDIILVEFYAPWCGHCKSLEPEYAKAAKTLKKDDPPIPLAKIDATVETELAARFEVTGYPTLYVFKKGEKILYEGPRTAQGIVEYMKERADPNWKPPPESVITLTENNFSDTVMSADLILVEFYAPWCGHCKRLAPEYERAARVLKDLRNPIPLAKVDGTAEKALAEKYEARGWPTLMMFRKGRKYPYEGPRDEMGIINYMKEQAKPPSHEAESLRNLKTSIGKIDATVVGFFDSKSDEFYNNFIECANQLRGKFNFVHTFKVEYRKNYGFTKPQIVLFMPELYVTDYEPTRFEFDNIDASVTEISEFVQRQSIPLVGERSRKNQWMYSPKYPLLVVYFDVDFGFDHRAQTQLIRKEVAKVAKDYKGKVTFVVSNENDYEDELKQLNLDDSGEDVNVGYFDNGMKYRMEPVEDFSEDVLRTFVEDVLAGHLPRHIKSQPIPKQNKGSVVTVVGSTFEDLVTKSSKDVLIEFYAPWCGHCKKLEPIYKKLGKAFEKHEHVMIAKIDATSNDYPTDFKVSGFPAIFYVPAKSKSKMITYDGERNLKDLTKFVNDQIAGEGDSPKDEL